MAPDGLTPLVWAQWQQQEAVVKMLAARGLTMTNEDLQGLQMLKSAPPARPRAQQSQCKAVNCIESEVS